MLLASRFFIPYVELTSCGELWLLHISVSSLCFWNAVLVESFSFDFATAYELSCIYSYPAPVYQEVMWNFFFSSFFFSFSYKYDTKKTDCYYVIYFPAQQGAVPGIVISSCWPSESVYPCFSGWQVVSQPGSCRFNSNLANYQPWIAQLSVDLCYPVINWHRVQGLTLHCIWSTIKTLFFLS